MVNSVETERVTFTIANPRVIKSKSLYALVDVDLQVAGVSFRIIGIQIRRDRGGLTVHLPTLRDVTGNWRPVIEMPEELRAPLGNAVMEFLSEEGLAKRRAGTRI
jgi:stage V sporulation protein G